MNSKEVLTQQRSVALAEWLLAAVFFLCPLTNLLVIKGEGHFGVSWSDTFLVAAMVAYLPVAMTQGVSLRIPTFLLVSAALLCIASLGSYADGAGSASLVNFSKLLISFLILPVASMWITAGRRAPVLRMLWFWLAGAVLSAIVALLDKSGISFLGWENSARNFSGRAAGIAFHPNALGYACALLIPVSIYLAVISRRQVHKYFCIASLGLLIAALLASGSRGSVLAMSLGLLVWIPSPLALRITRGHAKGLVLLGVGLLTVTLMWLLFGEELLKEPTSALSRLLAQLDDTRRSNDQRTEALAYGLSEFWSAPVFGNGFTNIRRMHNAVVQMLYCGGVIAVAASSIWWLGLFNCWQQLHRHTHLFLRADTLLSKLFLSVALVVITNNLFQPLLTDRNGYILFGLMLGVVVFPVRTPIQTMSASETSNAVAP